MHVVVLSSIKFLKDEVLSLLTHSDTIVFNGQQHRLVGVRSRDYDEGVVVSIFNGVVYKVNYCILQVKRVRRNYVEGCVQFKRNFSAFFRDNQTKIMHDVLDEFM